MTVGIFIFGCIVFGLYVFGYLYMIWWANDSQRRADTPDNAGSDVDNEFGVVNEYLSGFYVITGIEYFMTKGPQPGGAGLRQRLHLRRREITPST